VRSLTSPPTGRYCLLLLRLLRGLLLLLLL
jgi:hypothetical protein